MITICDDLRKSILQAAIQGKLTEQLESDGNAEDLYREIQGEKQKLIKEGKLKKEIPLPPIAEDEIPFDIPNSWKWVRLVDIAENCDCPFADGPFGSNLKAIHYTTNPEVRIIQLSNIGDSGWKNDNVRYTTFEHLKTIARSEVKPGDIVIAKMMPAGRAIVVPEGEKKYVLSSDAVKFVPHSSIDRVYLYYAINSFVFKDQVYSEVHGITRVRTSLTRLRNYLIPLPPLAEQKRVVAKLEELFAKIDVLEKDEQKLVNLYKEFPGDMKASLLQAAFQGKLTKQLDSDGNVEELYQEIQKEKQKLIKEGKVKKEKPFPEITEDEIPFDIPENWKWVRQAAVCQIYTGNSIPESTKETKYMKQNINGYSYIGTKDVNFNHVINYENGVHIPFNEPGFKIAFKESTLLCIEGGSAGRKIGLLDRDVCFGNKLCMFNPYLINSKFVYFWLQSPVFWNHFYLTKMELLVE